MVRLFIAGLTENEKNPSNSYISKHPAFIVLYVNHTEQEFSLRAPTDDYNIMLARKVEKAKAAISLFERESKRFELPLTRVATHSIPPRSDLQNRFLGGGDSPGEKIVDKRQAAEDADPEAPRKRAYVGRRIAKYFGKKLFCGVISGWDPAALVDDRVDLWKVDYDDGDEEDLEEEEMHICLDRYVQAQEFQLE